MGWAVTQDRLLAELEALAAEHDAVRSELDRRTHEMDLLVAESELYRAGVIPRARYLEDLEDPSPCLCECEVAVKGTGERFTLHDDCCVCGLSVEELHEREVELATKASAIADACLDDRPRGIVSESHGGVSVTYADQASRVEVHPGGILTVPYELSEDDRAAIKAAFAPPAAEPWKVPGNPGYIPPSATELMSRPAVPLTADPKLMDDAPARERWLPNRRGRPGSGSRELFPDRHPRLHRILRRFALYRDRQLRRLDDWYEEFGRDVARPEAAPGLPASPARVERR